MQKKVSVIVPIYNGQRFIENCFESILKQQNFARDDLDILAINDGSKDDSLKILLKYEKKYPTVIRIIDQKNIGAANTRNKGIQLATAKYITLIDQDDIIDSQYISTLYNEIVASEADVVQGGFELVDSTFRRVRVVRPVMTEFGKFLAIPAWAKMYRTEFLIAEGISFFDNNIGEDCIFTTEVIMKAKQYTRVDYAGYKNVFDNASNVTNTLHKGLSQSVNITALLARLSQIKSDDDTMQKMLEYNILRTGAYYLLSYGRHASSRRFYETYDEIFTWLKVSQPNIYRNRYIYRRPPGELMVATVGIKVLVTLHYLGLMRLFAILYCKRGKNG